MNFADVVNASHTTTENGNTDLNTLLDEHGFTYYYTHVNYEGENVLRPGGNAAELDPTTHDYTKAIQLHYHQGPVGYIEKTVNAPGTVTVYYGSNKSNWFASILKFDTEGTEVNIDTTNLQYKKTEINVVAGDTIRITEMVFLYAVIYPGT